MTTDKKTYYVSVNHNLIRDVPGDSNEFTVMLSKDELTRLKDLMNDFSSTDRYAFQRTFVPYKSADHDEAIEQFDERTIDLYAFLHEHGDERTRRMIEDMSIIRKMDDTGYDDPGYENAPLNK